MSVGSPEGLEYFTPLTPITLDGALYATPQIFTPVSRLSALAVRSYDTLKACPLTLRLLQYDSTIRKIRLIEALYGDTANTRLQKAERREKARRGHVDEHQEYQERRSRQKALAIHDPIRVTPEIKRHVHYNGQFTASGNARFEREGLLKSLLWSSRNLANEARYLIHEKQNEDPVVLAVPADTQGSCQESPEFWISVGSGRSATIAVGPLLVLLRHNKLIQSVLGLSQRDSRRWIGPWTRMTEEKAQLLNETVKCMFGDPGMSYPHTQNLSIIMHFISDLSTKTPILLHVSFRSLDSIRSAECTLCDSFALVLDYIGSAGALKIQVPARNFKNGVPWQSLDDLTREHRLEQTVFFSKWSPTAYLAQGLRPTYHMRQCFCNGAVHQGGFKPHFIDMQKEQDLEDEKWCTFPDQLTGEDFFHPFPGNDEAEGKKYVVENMDVMDYDSTEERWDPQAQEDPGAFNEQFDPYPSDDEVESRYLSRPTFLKFSKT